ncbi:thiamine-phosphate kinase [Erythrobacter mangrovi]|uniref:Thiamine-monophosphate kinase n=2 Tax=Erythrobacter mangrovi TaxID=2739433 RepID=A0A7D3XKF0_9SPHN|nr:thiamine-phosphate kinase [Erythrobacter mangrovi]
MATCPAARGLEDDAAVIPFGSETLILTHDTLVQGVHIREDEDASDIAWKLVAVNLSDLAAKGAEPLGVLVSHMLGEDDQAFVAGLHEVLGKYDVPLLGGDTVRAEGRRVWGCTAIGRATCTPVPDRRGAKPGDAVYVTGQLGLAMLGMEDRGSGSVADLAYRRPAPLLSLGRSLAPHVTAMMDISDGLLLDAARMAKASSCTLALDAARLRPLAPAGRFEAALRWGDDYQLLLTGPDGLEARFAVTKIGIVQEVGQSSLLLDGHPPQEPLGFSH